MKKTELGSPPKKMEKLEFNSRAMEYFTMLDDYDAGKVFKAILVSFFKWDSEEIEKIINDDYWTQKKMILMMYNEHLFDN